MNDQTNENKGLGRPELTAILTRTLLRGSIASVPFVGAFLDHVSFGIRDAIANAHDAKAVAEMKARIRTLEDGLSSQNNQVNSQPAANIDEDLEGPIGAFDDLLCSLSHQEFEMAADLIKAALRLIKLDTEDLASFEEQEISRAVDLLTRPYKEEAKATLNVVPDLEVEAILKRRKNWVEFAVNELSRLEQINWQITPRLVVSDANVFLDTLPYRGPNEHEFPRAAFSHFVLSEIHPVSSITSAHFEEVRKGIEVFAASNRRDIATSLGLYQEIRVLMKRVMDASVIDTRAAIFDGKYFQLRERFRERLGKAHMQRAPASIMRDAHSLASLEKLCEERNELSLVFVSNDEFLLDILRTQSSLAPMQTLALHPYAAGFAEYVKNSPPTELGYFSAALDQIPHIEELLQPFKSTTSGHRNRVPLSALRHAAQHVHNVTRSYHKQVADRLFEMAFSLETDFRNWMDELSRGEKTVLEIFDRHIELVVELDRLTSKC